MLSSHFNARLLPTQVRLTRQMMKRPRESSAAILIDVWGKMTIKDITDYLSLADRSVAEAIRTPSREDMARLVRLVPDAPQAYYDFFSAFGGANLWLPLFGSGSYDVRTLIRLLEDPNQESAPPDTFVVADSGINYDEMGITKIDGTWFMCFLSGENIQSTVSIEFCKFLFLKIFLLVEMPKYRSVRSWQSRTGEDSFSELCSVLRKKGVVEEKLSGGSVFAGKWRGEAIIVDRRSSGYDVDMAINGFCFPIWVRMAIWSTGGKRTRVFH